MLYVFSQTALKSWSSIENKNLVHGFDERSVFAFKYDCVKKFCSVVAALFALQ